MMNKLAMALKTILAAVLVAISGAAHAENITAAEAYAAGDKLRAFNAWKTDADSGDASAQFQVGNMLAVGQMVELDETSANFGYAVIADNAVYLIWLPIMLASKNFSGWFNKFTKVSDDRLRQMEEAAKSVTEVKEKFAMRHFLYLAFIGFAATTFAIWFADILPAFPPYLTASTYKILLVTILSLNSRKE